MFKVHYPDWCPPALRAALDQALLEAEEFWAANYRPVDGIGYIGSEETDRAAVMLAVKVVDAVARELRMAARARGWSSDTLTTTATMLSNQYIEFTYVQKHSKHEWYRSMLGRGVTLADFTAAVHRELKRSSPGWSIIERPADAGARESAVMPGQPSEATADTDDQAIRKAERERVMLPLLEERDWTPTYWATQAGVGPAVALDYLSGKTKKLQTKQRIHLARVLGIPPAFLP